MIVWLVPVMVTGPALPCETLLPLTNVIDSEPPLHAAGIDVSDTELMASFVTVQAMPMPLSVPHELTEALAPATFFDVAVVPLAAALLGTASNPPTITARTGLKRIAGYPVTTTDTPVTADAAMLLLLKSGEALPEASRFPVTSPSDVLPDPVRVTL